MNLLEDKLSVVLLGAALLYGALYMYEKNALSVLDESESRAQAIDLRGLNDSSCEAHAAGFSGRVLVLRCDTESDIDGYVKAIEAAALSAGFEELHVVLPHDRLRCARTDGNEADLKCEPLESQAH